MRLLPNAGDFCFVGSGFCGQAGGRDFALDLLFFRRGLNRLVAIEVKVGCIEPEYLGKLGFYLRSVNSSKVQSGLKDILLDHARLGETFRDRSSD